MKSIQYTITDELGIHARPAAELVKFANQFQSDIKIITADGKEANVKSIMGVMSLAVKQGDTITVQIDGADEADAAEKIAQVLNENL
jgi:phosphocarrier protein